MSALPVSHAADVAYRSVMLIGRIKPGGGMSGLSCYVPGMPGMLLRAGDLIAVSGAIAPETAIKSARDAGRLFVWVPRRRGRGARW
jgi:hypothetical protein